MRRTPLTRSPGNAHSSQNGHSGKSSKSSRSAASDFDESSGGHGDSDDVEHVVGHETEVDAIVDPEDAIDDDTETELDFDSVGGSSESHIDDPIRMYLMQMGEIPMLNREREISSAKSIEGTRTHFRRTILANDFVLQGAVELLEKVQSGELRLDRTIEISVTNTAEKKRTLKRIVPNLATIKHLLRLNQIDFRTAVNRRRSPAEKRAAWRRLVARRNKVVRLVEECNLRIARLMPIMQQLHEIAAANGDHPRASNRPALDSQPDAADRVPGRAPLPDADHARNAGHARPPRHPQQGATRTLRPRQTRAVGRQLAAGGFDRQAVSQPRLVVPRPDPRRQHRSDASGRQIRTRPRLQVLDLRHLVDSPGDHASDRRPKPHDSPAGPHDRHDGPGPQRHGRVRPAARPRSESGGSRRDGRPLARRRPLHHENDPPAPLARPAGGRPRRQLLRRVSRKKSARTTRCTKPISTASSVGSTT